MKSKKLKRRMQRLMDGLCEINYNISAGFASVLLAERELEDANERATIAAELLVKLQKETVGIVEVGITETHRKPGC